MLIKPSDADHTLPRPPESIHVCALDVTADSPSSVDVSIDGLDVVASTAGDPGADASPPADDSTAVTTDDMSDWDDSSQGLSCNCHSDLPDPSSGTGEGAYCMAVSSSSEDPTAAPKSCP